MLAFFFYVEAQELPFTIYLEMNSLEWGLIFQILNNIIMNMFAKSV